MKTKFSHLFIIVFVLAFTFISCKEKATEKKMILEVASQDIKFVIAGFGDMTIDWGDETVPETVFLEKEREYRHLYLTGGKHTITITGHITNFLAGRFYIDDMYATNNISTFDASKNETLRVLDCSENILTTLNISNCEDLKELNCYNNPLTSIDLTDNVALTHLRCWNNQLTKIDVSKNTALSELYCNNNEITNIDVSNNKSLAIFHLNGNKVSHLDVSDNIALKELFCHKNDFNSNNLNALFETLHDKTLKDGKVISISDNFGSSFCNINIAKNKGWQVIN